MKKLFSCILLLCFISNYALAECDFSKVSKNPDGSYTYSKELHVCVGEMKRDLELVNTQLSEYKKVIELKDLAISKANERSDVWMNTSFKLQDRMNTIEEYKTKNQVLSFLAGVALTGFAVWGAGQLR